MKKLTFKNKISIKRTMAFEKTFEPEFRLSLKEKTKLLKDCEYTYLFVDDKIAGETYTISVDKLKSKEIELPDDNEVNKDIKKYGKETAYYHSTAILSKYRGKGLSKIFKSYHNGYLKGLGYKYAVGHSTSPEIEKVNEFLGAKHIKTHKNWYETGKVSKFYKIKL